MTENDPRARARYHQDHKDDPDVWGEPEPPAPSEERSSGRALGATITVRFSPQEAERIREIAKAQGKPYSEIVRQALQSYMRPSVSVTPPPAELISVQVVTIGAGASFPWTPSGFQGTANFRSANVGQSATEQTRVPLA